MTPPSSASPPSTTLPKHIIDQAGSFRPTSPSHAIQVEHPIPNHAHLHIHTIRSWDNQSSASDESAVYDDDFSPPSSISAQILAPILNAPVPSSLRTRSPSKQASNSSVNGHSRSSNARAGALGSPSRSSSAKPHRPRQSNKSTALATEYLDLIGDGRVDAQRMARIRYLAYERGVPGHLRKVSLAKCSY